MPPFPWAGLRSTLLAVVIPLLALLGSAKAINFSIPAQSAGEALQTFSRQAGFEVLFSPKELTGVRTHSVVGEYEPMDALAALLNGTAFQAVRTGATRVVVKLKPTDPAKRSTPPALDGAKTNPPVTKRASASPSMVRLDTLVVTPSRFGVSDDSSVSLPAATFTHQQLATLPQLGEDLFRAIGRLPGLATVDYSAKFWVRGAPNEQVLNRLDGVTLLEPYHMKDFDGALSIIDLETVSRLDLISGGFSTEYGDRIGGVLLMETESPGQQSSSSTIGISLTGIRATNRGTFADGKGDWLVSGRMGYPDIALRIAEGNNEKLKPRYYDIFAKGEYQLTPNQTLAVNVLHSADHLTQRNSNQENLDSSYGNDYVWARWRGEFDERLKGEAVLSYAQLDWHRRGDGLTDNNLPFNIVDDRSLNLTTLRQDWSFLLTDRALLRSGFEVEDGSAKYDYHRLRQVYVIRNGESVIDSRQIDLTPSPGGVAGGAYTALRFQPTKQLTLEPGLRFDGNDYGAGGSWSPRFNAALDVGWATFRAAWGRYRQEEGLHEIDVMDGESTLHPAERAEHRVLSFETKLGAGMDFRAEAYERITANPRPHGENLINVGDERGEVLTDRVLLTPAHAEAQGLELILKNHGQKILNWSVSYTLAKTVETINGQEVPRVRDQRDTFYCDLSYHPNPAWEFTAAWQFHSGWPTTDVIYSNVTLNDGRVVNNQSFGPIYGIRLPDYHRLDLRATRQFKLKNSTLRVFVDIFNAYDRKNASNYNSFPSGSGGQLTARRTVEGLIPLLPSLGVIWDF